MRLLSSFRLWLQGFILSPPWFSWRNSWLKPLLSACLEPNSIRGGTLTTHSDSLALNALPAASWIWYVLSRAQGAVVGHSNVDSENSPIWRQIWSYLTKLRNSWLAKTCIKTNRINADLTHTSWSTHLFQQCFSLPRFSKKSALPAARRAAGDPRFKPRRRGGERASPPLSPSPRCKHPRWSRTSTHVPLRSAVSGTSGVNYLQTEVGRTARHDGLLKAATHRLRAWSDIHSDVGVFLCAARQDMCSHTCFHLQTTALLLPAVSEILLGCTTKHNRWDNWI